MAQLNVKLIEDIRKCAEFMEKRERYEHSLRVAVTCQELCLKFDYDSDIGYLAGLSHDLCKNMDKEELKKLVLSGGFDVTEYEESNLGLLHGKGASVLLKSKFFITDSDVLEAVAYHTTGKKDFCKLGKLLFISDRIEPGRKHWSKEFRESLNGMGLNTLCLTLLEKNMDYVTESEQKLCPFTYDYRQTLLDCISGGDL